MKAFVLTTIMFQTLTASLAFADLSLVDRTPIDRQPILERPILCRAPDLIVATLLNPEWDHATRTSIIKVVVKNQGLLAAGSFVVTYQDGTTTRSIAVAGLGVGLTRLVTFRIPYWVYRPDAHYTITVDSSNRIRECSEKNNKKTFFSLG